MSRGVIAVNGLGCVSTFDSHGMDLHPAVIRLCIKYKRANDPYLVAVCRDRLQH